MPTSGRGGGFAARDEPQLDGTTRGLIVGDAAAKDEQPCVLALRERKGRDCAGPSPELIRLVVIASARPVKRAYWCGSGSPRPQDCRAVRSVHEMTPLSCVPVIWEHLQHALLRVNSPSHGCACWRRVSAHLGSWRFGPPRKACARLRLGSHPALAHVCQGLLRLGGDCAPKSSARHAGRQFARC